MTDWELIRKFRENRSEAAFAQIVERHMKLVYWTCRRELKNEQLAEDATQAVFILFARKLPYLGPSVSISGWLFNSARFVSKDTTKREQRRVRREQEAALMMERRARDEEERLRVEPLLNDALSGLSASDRDVILMRYLNGFSLREIAGEIGTTEDTARMRVTRAVERMRRHLGTRNVALSAAVLGAILAEHSARAVPVACREATLASVRMWIASHASTHANPLMWKKGVSLLMEATRQKTIVGAVSLLLLCGVAITVPLALRGYHERSLAAAVGRGGFTDQVASSGRSNLGEDAAHKAIASNYQAISDSYNVSRNISTLTAMSTPDCMLFGAKVNKGKSMAGFVANCQPYLSSHPYMKEYITLKSFSVNGDTAIATVQMHEMTVMQKNDIAPEGHLRLVTNTDEDHWVNEGGKWLLAKSIVQSHQQMVM